MLRKNHGNFFYYLDVAEDGKTAIFIKKKRAIRLNPDRTTTKTKRNIYIRDVDLSEDGLASFHANTSTFDFNILKGMLEGNLK